MNVSADKRARPPHSPWPFVGRQRELDEVRHALRGAASGVRQVIMLVGEPGIGKTRMAEEIAITARQRRARVAWGRCWEGPGSPPYWPWSQIATALAPQGPARSAALAELADMVPELAPPGANQGRRPRRAPENRFRLFEALGRFLDDAARRRPLLVVIDDLHYADRPSLVALKFVARTLRDSRILFLCTYRDIEIGISQAGAELAGEIARESRRVVLGGLSRDEVAEVVRKATGVPPPDAVVEAVCAKTDGNAFFVQEVVRQLVATDALAAGVATPVDIDVPQGVREMIRSQLARLSAPANEILALASVMGREFHAAVVREVPGLDPITVPPALDEAVDAYLIEHSTGTRDNFRFSHTLTRETIYDDLGAARRALLHRQLAEAIEATNVDLPNRIVSLAHHYYEAAAGGDSGKALEYSIMAAEEAGRRLAYEEAARHYERALTLLGPGDAPRRRAELLLEAGEAYTRAGSTNDAKGAFERCATVARAIADPELLARAALGYGGRIPGFHSGVVDDRLISILGEAAAGLGNADSPLRAMLLARLSRALFYAGCEEHRRALSEEALEMARRVDDVPAQISALNSRYWALVGPADLSARVAIATETAALANSIGDRETVLQAHHWRITEFAQLGDRVAVRAEIEAYSRLADELKQPLYTWFARHFRIMLATTEGRFDDAEREIHQGIDEERRAVTEYPPRMFLAQLSVLRSLQGRWQEAEALRSQSLDDSYGLASRAVAATHLWLLGHREEAGAEFEYVMSQDLAGAPRDAAWLAMITTLSRICAWLDDVDRAAKLYDLILPYAGLNVVTGGMFYGGTASHYLGLLAAVMRRWGDAAGHFEQAIDLASRSGARPHLAATQYEFARVLVGSDLDGRMERAWDLLTKAVPAARALGVKALARQAAELQSTLREAVGATVLDGGRRRSASSDPAVATNEAADRIDEGNALVREGHFWTLTFEGSKVRLKGTKGLEYIAVLLRNPHQQIHVSRLAGVGEEVWGDGGAPAVLDPQATAAYRKRVEELREDLHEAQEFNDAGKVSRLSDELEFLHHELTSAYGLGGRPRKLDDRTEKTRKAVGNRVRSTLAHLHTQHPDCARHLTATLNLGTFCSYSPEKPTRWVVVIR